jgi:hypothetical protein
VLHNQHALLIKGALFFKRNIVVTSVPYHLGWQAEAVRAPGAIVVERPGPVLATTGPRSGSRPTAP